MEDANAIICIFLSKIDILILGTLVLSIWIISKNETSPEQWVEPKYITSNDVISSNWHERDTNDRN